MLPVIAEVATRRKQGKLCGLVCGEARRNTDDPSLSASKDHTQTPRFILVSTQSMPDRQLEQRTAEAVAQHHQAFVKNNRTTP